LKTAIRLRNLIRSEQVSIVHTFFPTADLFGGAIAKLSGCRPILISSRRDMGFQRTVWHNLAYRPAGSMFDQVQAVAEAVRIWHIHHDRLSPDKAVTVYNGVDLAEIDRTPAAALPAGLGVENAAGIVVCVANLRPIKGLEVLISTAAIVCRSMPGVRFLIIGQPSNDGYMERLFTLARDLGVERTWCSPEVFRRPPLCCARVTCSSCRPTARACRTQYWKRWPAGCRALRPT
jgi:glycosyltransferase involved in cell wall biosynthesis